MATAQRPQLSRNFSVDYQVTLNGILASAGESELPNGGVLTSLELQGMEEAQQAGIPVEQFATRVLNTRRLRKQTVTGPTLRDAIALVRGADACPTCHLPRGLANVNAVVGIKGHRAERPVLGQHCACEGGPAEYLRVELRAFVAATFDGAKGDGPLPFPTLDAALEQIEEAITSKAGRPLNPVELGGLRAAVRVEWFARLVPEGV